MRFRKPPAWILSHQTPGGDRRVMFTNDIDQSLLFAVAFLAAIFMLPLFLARLDQPHDAGKALASATDRFSRWFSLQRRRIGRREDRG